MVFWCSGTVAVPRILTAHAIDQLRVLSLETNWLEKTTKTVSSVQ